ncbi:MAG: hypothetical protein P4L81_05020 [Candidatus Pacebacteria bacterium]|nr:hypothetical protein [Candidatus Paceibacterota bacterium]
MSKGDKIPDTEKNCGFLTAPTKQEEQEWSEERWRGRFPDTSEPAFEKWLTERRNRMDLF